MKPTNNRRRPVRFRPVEFAPPIVGVLDCRTAAEKAADEAAGLTWEKVAELHLAGQLEALQPARPITPVPSRN
jgi:hypothetical protein